MSTKPQFHGSDIEAACAYYHIPQEQIVCFGANVNPLGLSESVKEKLAKNLDLLSSYPDRNYTSLKKVIGNYCRIDPTHVIVGNGSTELISLLIQTRKPKKALILGPTYSEYERELSLVGGMLTYYSLKEADDFHLNIPDFCSKITDGYELVIICNPNNPTSSALHMDELEIILKSCKKSGSFLMIDETYVEFAPDVQEITAMSLVEKYDNLAILRGVSKFFAAPGMRLGYGATSNLEFLQSLISLQNPWSLNSLGAFAGELMLQDRPYIKKTRTLIQSERERMYEFLKRFKELKVYPAYANFILVRILDPCFHSSDIFEFLFKKGLMIRDCSTFEQLEGEYFRFCIMRPEDNERLLNGIEEYLQRGR